MFWLVLLYLIIPACLANTETYLLKIPQYYDIPSHPQPMNESDQIQRNWHRINSSLSVLLDYPIATIYDELEIGMKRSNVVSSPYDSVTQLPQTILVRLNNYNDSVMDNKDLLNVKLCWPATSPFDFRISHEYIKTGELISDASLIDHNQLDIYLRIDYQFFGITFDEKFLNSQDNVKFQLYVNKLPFKLIPIPLELYDFVIYLVDLVILVITQFPLLTSILNIKHASGSDKL
ncbi:hypothetical protein CANMA_003288 [Candida margitis]|uniref:uncharacterized protein n=1 Tax=Candida margitis TaxID=1775924 RepID=UPI00222724CF|nr:uncharacterized protein CANMA_003288 [Candida margitis]KAI5966042.1 hypothetical protein CANMA_003288 [Candida margitis]